MLLAEALARRADLNARMNQLATRAVGNALHQEGDSPSEDPTALLAEHDRLAGDLAELVAAINRTNLGLEISPGVTMTEALARRDELRTLHRVRTNVADAASRRQDRITRSEVKYVPAVDVAAVRQAADDAARELRELDTRIQEVNWTSQLQQ
ncbi:DIP1984 family protein [Pseudactinotalea sp.]|uniref:DIP1984 family protein n=1 Tax=Pseudactinotalea sp. TaxID=1926260 RepID=UPI003B3A720F